MHLLLSAQRALLGHVGNSVLAIAIQALESQIELTAYAENRITDDEKEALDMALTEVLADFPTVNAVELYIITDAQQPFHTEGHWVFIRLGVLVV
jgi:hypothetical protein